MKATTFIFTLLLASAFLGLASPATEAAEVFKCKSADGKVKYQSQPCEDSTAQEKLRIDSGPSAEEESSEQETSSSDTPQLDKMLANAENPALKEQLELRKKQCEMARRNLKEYESADFLVEKNADGTERELTSDEVAREKARVQRFIESECK